MSERQLELGQHFTEATGENNPFTHPAFKVWASRMKIFDTILEPFAGNRDLVRLLNEAGYHNQVDCFDIDPKRPDVTQRDTIKDMPTGYRYCVTNPPYLDKSSATKKKIKVDFEGHPDRYLQSIRKCFDQVEFVAAIIPLSFINAGYFRDCLETVISLNYKLFSKTECPVCLALFKNWERDQKDPTPCETFTFWIGNTPVGFFDDFDFVNQYDIRKNGKNPQKIKTNQKTGIAVNCIDLGHNRNIRFFRGDDLKPKAEKFGSRSNTRIDINRPDIDQDTIIFFANKILEQQRNSTGDSFLTPFMGLRSDKQYRQRLSFTNAKLILNLAIQEHDKIPQKMI